MTPTTLFTCIACQVGFHTADQQREHYHTDWHRYNLKRKVVNLPPVSAENFALRLQTQREESRVAEEAAQQTNECSTCGKSYNSRNALDNHFSSRKHKESVLAKSKAATQPAIVVAGEKSSADVESRESDYIMVNDNDGASANSEAIEAEAPVKADSHRAKDIRRRLNEAKTEEEVIQILKEKEAAAIRLNPAADCLFCPHQSQSLEGNMDHMTAVHSFFIPDIEYLIDLKGLLTYLAHKISVENTCLFCNGKGKSFHCLESTRKHMIDKGHMKIAYEDGADLEVANFYDFSSTWVDVGDMADKDADLQLVPHSASNQLMVLSADSMEMTLPTGQRMYHRSMLRYLKQSFKPVEHRESVIINKLASQYRALGWYQHTAASVSKEQKISQRSERRSRFEQVTKVGLKANGLQRHFREQIDY